MRQQTLEECIHRNGAEQADTLMGSSSRSALLNSNFAQYVHPFTLVPKVAQPELHTMFTDEATQLASRNEALFNLSALTITEQSGPTDATDSWLEILRQNVRNTSDTLAEFGRERASMMGLAAMYLASDTSLRQSPEAAIYQARVSRAEFEADAAYITGSPYRAAHLAIKQSLSNLQGTPLDVARNVPDSLPTNPESPEFTYAKAKALFEYASTMPTSEQKRRLLLESMEYATETIARADPGNNVLRGSALHLVSRSIHDISYIPLAYSWNDKVNNGRTEQARMLSVELLQRALSEFHTAHANRVPTPPDTSKQWQVRGGFDRSEEYARYFAGIYVGHTTSEETAPGNPDIKSFITAATAQKFGHDIVSFAEMNIETTAEEPVPLEYALADAS